MAISILDFITPTLFDLDDGPAPEPGVPIGPLPPRPELLAVGPPIEWDGFDTITVSWGDLPGEGYDVTLLEW